MLLNSLLCYPEVFPLKSMFKRTQDLKGSDVGFCLEALRGMSKCEGVPAEAVPSSACKSTVILCSNKGLGFQTLFQKRVCFFIKGDLAREEE